MPSTLCIITKFKIIIWIKHLHSSSTYPSNYFKHILVCIETWLCSDKLDALHLNKLLILLFWQSWQPLLIVYMWCYSFMAWSICIYLWQPWTRHESISTLYIITALLSKKQGNIPVTRTSIMCTQVHELFISFIKSLLLNLCYIQEMHV